MSDKPNCGPTARRATGEPDPIFAAMERLRAARGGWLAAYDRLGVLQEMIPEARRRWQILFNERPDDCTDAPEWIEANTAFLAAIEELAKALEVVLSTPPTTITGVADLLDYVGRYECQPLAREYPGTIVEYALGVKSVEGVKKAWANFLPMIAATLPRRATGEADPIFAAIERHQAALRGCLAADDRRRVLWDVIPKARRRWIEANTAFIEATEELDKALEVVLSTPPTTITGVADLLDYVSSEVAGAGALPSSATSRVSRRRVLCAGCCSRQAWPSARTASGSMSPTQRLCRSPTTRSTRPGRCKSKATPCPCFGPRSRTSRVTSTNLH
jgi:hypothetical protein